MGSNDPVIIGVKWSEGSCFKCDPSKAKEITDDIRQRVSTVDELKETLVKEAKAKAHGLHDEFEWDDKKAAHNNRLDVASKIVRSIQIVYEDLPDTPVRAYQIVTDPNLKGSESRSYVSTSEAFGSKQLRSDVLAQAKRELDEFRRKYKNLQELAKIIEAIDGIL